LVTSVIEVVFPPDVWEVELEEEYLEVRLDANRLTILVASEILWSQEVNQSVAVVNHS
jgi:hypothetical protein